MAQKIKGKCKYCGQEYTVGYMCKHLASCKKRQEKLSAAGGREKRCGYYLLKVQGKYAKDYWLFLEMPETAKLRDLDSFLRDIWLECCGHLSAFRIGGVNYDLNPEDWCWGDHTHSMNVSLKKVLQTGMVIEYEYDFGSTTELLITVIDYQMEFCRDEDITILSRNNSIVHMCSECGKKEAVLVNVSRLWEGKEPYLCGDCAKKYEEEEYCLNVCNSPRMGVCGYEGSEIYPDQFEPDV